jgi:hypothetical protein
MGLFDRFKSKPQSTSMPQSVRKTVGVSESYFEVERPPRGDGLCSDDACPCGYPGETIPRGTGYLFITPEMVEFHRDARSIAETRKKMNNKKVLTERGVFSGNASTGPILINPILICKRGALRRQLDMEVAAADAKYWWETGLVPLRPTPYAFS